MVYVYDIYIMGFIQSTLYYLSILKLPPKAFQTTANESRFDVKHFLTVYRPILDLLIIFFDLTVDFFIQYTL